MAEVGTYYITIMPSMDKFTGAVNSALGSAGTSGGKSFSGSFLDVLKGSAIGTMLGNIGTKLGSEIVGGLDVGIRRLDTLENFPRVMESLGYSTKDADASVKLIMEHLDGLPTTTQDMVTLTQAIADSTGDLDLATRAALGFNDMMLANGASAGEMTQAMGVFNRVLGKGNATTAQWMSLQSVMPAQLALVAREMLGEKASAEDLRDALNNGEVSWNDFLAAIVRLDEEETGSVASFTEQAKANVDGIGTALTNLPNRIGQGWASIFEAIGRQNISGPINDLSYGIRDAMEVVADGIKWLKYTILGSDIDESLATIFGSLKEAFGSFANELAGYMPTIKEVARGIIDFIDGALKWLADHPDIVTTALAGIAGAFSALAGIQIGTGLMALPALIEGIVAAFNPLTLVVGAIGAVVVALTWFFTETETGRAMLEAFITSVKEWWASMQQAAEDFATAVGAVWLALKQEWEDTVNQIKQNLEANKLVWENFKKSVSDKVYAVKMTVVNTWNALMAALGSITDNIKTKVTDTWDALKTTVSTIVVGIYTSITSKFRDACYTALSVFDDIKNGITEKIESAKEAVSRIIDKIKGLFNFSWSLPAPKLPHINWHWNDLGGIVSIPVFDGISWYARGGLFTQPTLAGLGEAGDEAALPLTDAVYSRIAQGISDQMGAGGILITGNTFNVRDEDDIQRIVERLVTMIIREMGAAA